eukprot:CAMPEP_0184687754 /NCGR_PEP_ID=MMETSP0312-20130426/27478_1 /TAXON_ID=31354 /ORGANISM="Compsopogon coeruleus, Strain SAG 36.94" /LENGTH=56 /DNA_ID=CAMNT_0027144221 /DNA_START=84 /DNA_END=251 /DNA_ORIENTATION=+
MSWPRKRRPQLMQVRLLLDDENRLMIEGISRDFPKLPADSLEYVHDTHARLARDPS